MFRNKETILKNSRNRAAALPFTGSRVYYPLRDRRPVSNFSLLVKEVFQVFYYVSSL